MCGIAGFVDKNVSEVSASRYLACMLEAIHHRGPDGNGSYFDHDTGLCFGTKRLSIIDIQGGNQPIWNEDQSICVVFNGEIYNYIELQKYLVGRGHKLKTHCDTEVLVHMYEEYGVKMFSQLRGMFSFSLFDKNKRILLLARDHFGQKPLYYSISNNRIAFASEIKSLFCLPFVARDINEESFYDYISWFSIKAPDTHYKYIKKLMPGSFIQFHLEDALVVTENKYWSYQPAHTVIDDMDEAEEKMDAALYDSIKLHLRADVPVGLLLSSGLDSRIIAAYANKIQPSRITTFSVGFDSGYSELEGARLTSKELSTEHHEITLTANDLLENIQKVSWHLDEPVADPAAFAILKISEYAKDHVKVILGGEGADELFSGYAERYLGIISTLQRSDRLRTVFKYLPDYSNGSPKNRWERLRLRTTLSHFAEIAWLRIEGLPGNILEPLGLEKNQFNNLIERCEQLATWTDGISTSVLEEIQAFDISWQLPESLLVKADRMSMAASIELRSPFLDTGISSLAASLHSSLKLTGSGIGKLILRRCLDRHVPEGLLRQKRGFPVPLDTWLARDLREVIEDEVISPGSPVHGFIERRNLEEMWHAFIMGDSSLARVFYALWLYVTWSGMQNSLGISNKNFNQPVVSIN